MSLRINKLCRQCDFVKFCEPIFLLVLFFILNFA